MRQLFTLLLLTAATAGPATTDDGRLTLVDRVVAVVDEEAILLSDVHRVIALGLVERRAGETERQLERRVLDGLIDQRLRLHEVERHDFGQLPADEVDRQVERIRAHFDDPRDLRQTLERLGLDDEGLRLLVGRQLRVLVYVEKRLGPRVFVNADDVRAYYEDVLTVEMATRGQEPPPLDEVRRQIRDLLHEKRLNEQIEAWTEELREEADVSDLFERPERELPPVVERLRGGS